MDRMAEWSALRTALRRASGSIPDIVKTIFVDYNCIEF